MRRPLCAEPGHLAPAPGQILPAGRIDAPQVVEQTILGPIYALTGGRRILHHITGLYLADADTLALIASHYPGEATAQAGRLAVFALANGGPAGSYPLPAGCGYPAEWVGRQVSA